METLEIANELKKVGIASDNAYRIAETINGRSGLATKEDIGHLRNELKEDITDLRSELKDDIADLRSELKEDIGNLRSELKEDAAEMKRDIAWMKWVLGFIVAALISGFSIIISLLV